MSAVGIVGGGILGMTLARRLRAQGHVVTVLEAGPRLGGLASPASHGPYTWDRFYHVTLMSDRHLMGLLDELGLSDRLRWGTTRTGVFAGGVLHSLSTTLEFLRFRPLSLVGRARLALTILRAAYMGDGDRMEAELATTWLERWSGRKVFENLWRPLLRSKLGDNYRIASAAFIWAIIQRMYAARRSGLKREMFGYVDGGYDTVLRRLEEDLVERGVHARCGARVSEVRSDGDSATVDLADGETLTFDNVILTVPTHFAAKLCPQLSAAEKERLGRVVYQGIVCPSVLLRKPLADYYVTNITDSGLPFTGVIELTTLVDRERFDGNSLVYLPRYLAQDDPFWKRSDEEIEEEFLAGLERMYPDFRREDVVSFQVSRVRYVLAVSTLHYSTDVLPPMRTSLANVLLVNSAQISHGTLNVNETIALGERSAEKLAPLLRAASAAEPVGC